jgi:ABC-type uncharacterized transport system permease subunit
MTMRDTLALIGHYYRASIRSQIQYKASLLLLTLAHLLATGIDLLGLAVLFAHFGQLRGWTLAEVAVFYGVTNAAFSLADAVGTGFDRFGTLVKSGGFDRLLLRPRSTALQLAAQELTLRRAGRHRRHGRRLRLCGAIDHPGHAGLLDHREPGGDEHHDLWRGAGHAIPRYHL